MVIGSANRVRGNYALDYLLCVQSKFYGQATKGMRVDALAQVGDEGRGQLR